MEQQRPVSLPVSNEVYLLQKYRWLILSNQSSITFHSDPRMDSHYHAIVLPPPPYKPRGKATVENHVKYLETHLVEKLKEKVHTSLEGLNAEIKEIIADLNTRQFQHRTFSRQDAFERYDKPCMKPLPGGAFTVKKLLHINAAAHDQSFIMNEFPNKIGL